MIGSKREASARVQVLRVVALLALTLGALSAAGGVASEPRGRAEAGSFGPWRPLFQGVDSCSAATEEPRPLRLHAVRIDLEDPDVDFLVTPSNGEKPGETDGMKTSTFLRKYRCQLAVNASPFRPVTALEGGPKDVIGLSVSRGERYSEAEGDYGALVITKGRAARIAPPPVASRDAHNAVGGFRMLLDAGKNVGAEDALHPRTAVGISDDGRFLFLLAIDGRQRGYSEGATTAETAEWLRKLGAHTGLNLDGGGSTSLVVEDDGEGFRLLNRPIHAGLPGTERVNANHLGVFAKPLPRPDGGEPPAEPPEPRRAEGASGSGDS